jgi:hypothetical protein
MRVIICKEGWFKSNKLFARKDGSNQTNARKGYLCRPLILCFSSLTWTEILSRTISQISSQNEFMQDTSFVSLLFVLFIPIQNDSRTLCTHFCFIHLSFGISPVATHSHSQSHKHRHIASDDYVKNQMKEYQYYNVPVQSTWLLENNVSPMVNDEMMMCRQLNNDENKPQQ